MKKIGLRKLLVVGAGDIGRRVIEGCGRLHAPFAAITAMTSNPAHRSTLKRLGAKPLLANLDRSGTLSRLPPGWTALLHAAPPQSYLSGDLRTRNLLRAIEHQSGRKNGRNGGRNGADRALVYLSTSGVYGDCGGARITESHPLRPHNARAKRRVDAERRLIRAARRGVFRLIILRVPGIYAADRLPLARLKAGTAALRDEDDVYTNHIHASDLAAISLAALARLARRKLPRVRIYHASDDGELKMGAWFDLIADAFGLPHPPRQPRSEIAGVVSPALLSFMNESRRLDNTRMKRELRVRLQFATAAEGVAAARLVIAQA